MRHHICPAVILALAALGTASAQRGGRATFTLRDSAGVLIIDNQQPMIGAAQTPRLRPAPDVVIGDKPGAMYELSRVAGAVQLSDGRIVVADGATRQLRFFDSTGTFLTSAGRQGDGPGELRNIQSLSLLPGDTIAVVSAGRISFFTSRGSFVSTIMTQNPPPPLPAGPKEIASVISTGSYAVAVVGNPPPRSRGDRWVHDMPMAILSPKNQILGDLGRQPIMEAAMEDQPRPVWLGAVLAAAADTRLLYLGIGTEYSIRGYSTDGKLRTIVRRAWAPHRITPDEIDLYVREWGKRWIKSTGAAAEAERRDLRDDPYAINLPAFSQFLVSTTDRLWVREPNVIDAAWAGALSDTPLAPSRWSVFDPQGRWLTVVTLPARFRLTHIGSDYVLGVARDDDDVETVVRYRLRIP